MTKKLTVTEVMQVVVENFGGDLDTLTLFAGDLLDYIAETANDQEHGVSIPLEGCMICYEPLVWESSDSCEWESSETTGGEWSVD